MKKLNFNYRPRVHDVIKVHATPDRRVEPTIVHFGHTYRMIQARVTPDLGVQAFYKRIR